MRARDARAHPQKSTRNPSRSADASVSITLVDASSELNRLISNSIARRCFPLRGLGCQLLCHRRERRERRNFA